MDYSEKISYKTSTEYINALTTYKGLQYKISVYIGGSQPLIPVITTLLNAQKVQTLDYKEVV